MSGSQRLLVIGGVAAGLSAASKAKRLRPDLDVVVFEKSGFISYGACGLPYYVGGMIDRADDLVSLTVDDFRQKRGIAVHTRHEAVAVDRARKTVLVKDLASGAARVWPYDKLVIATGAVPVRPAIPGVDGRGVFFLRDVEDGIRLKQGLRPGMRIAVAGGGFVGLETAEQLSLAGMRVTVYEAAERLLPAFPEAYARLVREELERHGVAVRTSFPVSAIETKDGAACGVRHGSDVDGCDAVLLALGVRPASGLAADSGLPLGVKGAIVVDGHMRTADPSVWACGDCVQVTHRLTGKPCWLPLGTTANKTGRVAGADLAGGVAVFPGVLGSQIAKVFDLAVASTGLSLEAAKAEGFPAAAVSIVKGDRASYYPGGLPTYLTLVFAKDGGRLLGAQAVGGPSVAGRIDTLCACITAGMTVREVDGLDLVYAPPFAPVYDPILIAADQAGKQVEA